MVSRKIILLGCLLAASMAQASESFESQSLPKLVLNEESRIPREHVSVGFNYLGAQVRWGLSSRWAVELRTQHGHATSNYGDVNAQTFGLRAYRFFKRDNRLEFYVGPEIAYASAEAQNSSYKTTGMAMGAFGGIRFRIASRISLDTDLGPYVISLKEKQTGVSSTNLDFVLNSALVVRIF